MISMSSQKKKGTWFETATAKYLDENLDCHVERRALGGVKDRGDIAGVVTAFGVTVVVECKNCAKYEIPKWLGEAEAERVNDGADIAVVVAKRKGVGETRMEDQLAIMTLGTLKTLFKGEADGTD